MCSAAEIKEEPEQAFRKECALLGHRMDRETEALKVRIQLQNGVAEWKQTCTSALSKQ